MQELIDMFREMAGACKRIAHEYPTGMTHALQATRNGSYPGIRCGLPLGLMLRIYVEQENNNANSESRSTEADAWNSLWVDPERQRETE